MKPTKGLSRDNQPSNQPEGTYPFGKNGVQYEKMGEIISEPGLRRLSAVIPYRFNGLIETSDKPVIFSTDNVSSAIGYFNPKTEVYEPIVDDNPGHLVNFPANGQRIGLNTEYYVRGQAQRNYKGETVVAFTDRHGLPMYLNCDKPAISALSDLRLFPYFREPTIKALQSNGGSLPDGAYFVAIGYEKNDGTSTAYSAISDVTVLRSSSITGTSDSALQIVIQNADTNYEYMRVAIISRVKGVLSAIELTDYLPVTQSGRVELDYTGDNLSTDIDVSQILVAPVIYDRVAAMGQLNDYLYLLGLHQEPDINDMQPWANLVRMEWESNLIQVTALPEEHRSGSKKSRMHGEVYAMYIRYHKTSGGFTKWFHAPGNDPITADLQNSTESTGTADTYPRFKLEDTIRYWDPTAKTGATGIWRNTTEVYPNTPDFDSTAIGGRNLRNQPVLHHKMPSLQWCQANLYASEVEYGKTKLDLLGIRAVNVRIPDKYKGILDGYEIGYAKRSGANATISGQGLMLHPAVDHYGQSKPTGQVALYTSGGNWSTGILHRSDNNYDDNLELVELRPTAFRTHPFDLLFAKPSISPTLVHAQYKLRYDNITKGHGWLEDGDNGDDLHNAEFPYSYCIDYTLGNKPQFPAANFRFKKVTESLYLTGTINAEQFINTRHEACFAGYMATGGNQWPLQYSGVLARIKGSGVVGEIAFEEAYMINLVTIRQDIYQNFYSQPVVSAGQWQPLTTNVTVWGGDTFCGDYTFHTYGRHDSADTSGDGIRGKKVIRRIICETSANLAMRYEVPGNIYSKWYPVTPVAADDVDNYITLMDRSQDPNQFGYDREFNALNDFVSQLIFSPYREELSDFPFRVHRGGKASRTGRPRAWRSFLPLDYYEMPKDKGIGVNVEGLDDTLLIHMEHALFRTRDKAKLESGVLSITLGSGDIFQFEPQEALGSKLGYAGTQHPIACLKSPVGYLFPDARSGEFFLFKEGLNQLNPGLNRFLNDYLQPEGDNVLQGNGITVGWDKKYRRILLTVKHRKLPPVIKQFSDTPAFWDSLQVGDIIQYGSRLVTYTGPVTVGCNPDPTPPVVTWEPVTSYCILQDGRRIGLQAFSTRRKLVNGVPVLTENNDPNGGEGPYFPPVGNLTACPKDPDVITWEKRDPLCITNTSSTCPGGYTLSGDGTVCVKTTTTAATVTSSAYKLAPSQNAAYSNFGTRIYTNLVTSADLETASGSLPPGHLDTEILNTLWGNAAASPTAGPMNVDGVWVDIDGDGTRDSLAAGVKTTIAFQYTNSGATRTVYVGMGGDNQFQFKLNGAIIVETGSPAAPLNFKYWHIIPVTIVPGVNNFNLVGTGDGSVNDSLAMVVYDNTELQLASASSYAGLTILFRSSQLIGQTVDVATCPDGYSLDTSGGSGHYVCNLRETAAPTQGSGNNTGVVRWQNRARLTNGVLDGFTQPNAPGANYFPDETDHVLCPIAPPVPPLITISGTVTPICTLTGSSNRQGATSLHFVFSAPTPVAMELQIGIVEKQSWNGALLYVGSEVFTPPTGATGDPYYAVNMGVDKAFLVNIPAGSLNFTVPQYIYQRTGYVIDGVSFGAWICLPTVQPLVAMYIKLDQPTAGYAIALTSTSSSITVTNV